MRMNSASAIYPFEMHWGNSDFVVPEISDYYKRKEAAAKTADLDERETSVKESIEDVIHHYAGVRLW